MRHTGGPLTPQVRVHIRALAPQIPVQVSPARLQSLVQRLMRIAKVTGLRFAPGLRINRRQRATTGHIAATRITTIVID